MVFKPAEQEMMEWATEKESKGGCANNMCMNGKRHITYAHAEILCTSEGTRCAAIHTFHVELVLCIDLHTDFFCKIFSDDDNLRALVENTCFCVEVIHQHINLLQGEGKLSFMFSC